MTTITTGTPDEPSASVATFRPFSTPFRADPYPAFAALRADAAATYSEELDMWVVTRHDDCGRVMAGCDGVGISSRITADALAPFCPNAARVLREGVHQTPVMSNLDPPDHSRIRRHLQAAFSRRRVADLESFIREAVGELLSGALDHDRFDWVEEVAFPLPSAVINRLLGFPDEDGDMLKKWAGDRLTFLFGHPGEADQLRVAQNMASYWRYCVDFVATRRSNRADDLTSALLNGQSVADDRKGTGGEALTDLEIASVLYGLSLAGHETTTNLLVNMLLALLRHRDQWDALCADGELIPDAVEEALRYDSSVNAWRRFTLIDVELSDGTVVPAMSKVLILLGSANRDPAVFDDPDVFDIGRTDARQHLSFGKGVHFCLGAPLARLEARVVFEELTRRAPQIRLVHQQLDYPPVIAFRGPRRLLIDTVSSIPREG